jgi:hypothetical protein
MTFKPNYGLHRAERDRAKRAKKEEKLRQRQELAAERKAAGLPPAEPGEEDPAP